MKKLLLFSMALAAFAPGLRAQNAASAAPSVPAAATNNLLITARSLHYDHGVGVAIYQGDVRVEDPDMIMNCGKMTVRLAQPGKNSATNPPPPVVTNTPPPAPSGTNALAKSPWEFDSRRIHSIDAEHDVMILLKKDKSKASGDKAVFTAATGRMELTGNSYIETENGYLVGDIIIWDRNANTLNATNPRTVLRNDFKGRTNRVTQPTTPPPAK
jgi:lipopolysaccharide export system protein LptA